MSELNANAELVKSPTEPSPKAAKALPKPRNTRRIDSPDPVNIEKQIANVRKSLNEEEKKKEVTSGRTVLIFGQGPVLTDPEDRVNYWSNDLAEAAAILKKRDPGIHDFAVLGGKTGPPGHASEAELIAKKMLENGVPEEAVLREEMSNDTIENLVNFLNMTDGDGSIGAKQFDILCAPYHSARVQVLMQLFQIPIGNVYQSTEVLRFAARNPDVMNQLPHDQLQWDHTKLQEIEDKVNLNYPTKYSSTQSPKEQRPVDDRYIKDDLWTRELLEHPEKWLRYVGQLKNRERVHAILAQVDELYPGMLASEPYAFVLPEEGNMTKKAYQKSMRRIRTKLRNSPPYGGLPTETVDSWVEQNKTGSWPEKTKSILNNLLKRREVQQTS